MRRCATNTQLDQMHTPPVVFVEDEAAHGNLGIHCRDLQHLGHRIGQIQRNYAIVIIEPHGTYRRVYYLPLAGKSMKVGGPKGC